MIPYSVRCVFRRYVPSKPNPKGLKYIVASTANVLILDFKICMGKVAVLSTDLRELCLDEA